MLTKANHGKLCSHYGIGKTLYFSIFQLWKFVRCHIFEQCLKLKQHSTILFRQMRRNDPTRAICKKINIPGFFGTFVAEKSFCYCCIVLVGWTISNILQLREMRRNMRDFYFFGKWHATWETFTFSGNDTQRGRLSLFREMTRNVGHFYFFGKWHATWETSTIPLKVQEHSS